MPYDLTKPLVIGISSRALFDLEEENEIYEKNGLEAYIQYQIENEQRILQPGAGFELIKAFLRLNDLQHDNRLVEVIIISRNSPDSCLRIFNSIGNCSEPPAYCRTISAFPAKAAVNAS